MDNSNTNFNQNSARIYTGSAGGELYISTSDSKQTISASNNRSQYYAELAKKYRDEAKILRDDTKYYAEQNTDVTVEFVNNVKAELLREIDTKQDSGDFALKTDLPTNISELENDSQYVTNKELTSTLDVFLPNQENNINQFLMTNGTDLSWQSLNGFSLFDTRVSDYVLEGQESLGWALQGTYVYKEAIAGSRYGYPDFYNKCLEEYQEATSTETVNDVEVKVHSNGHKFYNISDKDSIDNFFNSMGYAWFYGIDTENERIFLPRNNYYAISGISKSTPVVGNGMALGLTYDGINIRTLAQSGSSTKNTFFSPNYGVVGTDYGSVDASGMNKIWGVSSNKNYSGLIAQTSNIIQTDENKYLYICVGNTTNYEGISDVVNQGMEILEQVAQKVNTDGTNLNSEGKSLISGFAMPSGKYFSLTTGADNSKYTAPANGWFAVAGSTNGQGMVGFTAELMSTYCWVDTANNGVSAFIPVTKDMQVSLRVINATVIYLRFIYAEGEQ